MKRLLFFLMAMIFAIQGWTQTLNESFEGATFPPEDWTTATTAGSGTWQSSTSISHSGTKSAKSAYQSGGTTRWLITPKLSVTSDVTNFAFWIATNYWYSDGDNIEIFVSTTDNQTSSFSTTPLLALTKDSVTTTWTQHSVDLSSYVGQDIYVAIRVTDNNGFNTFIDDVTGPNLFVPSCPKPNVLTYSNIGALNADISWTETGTASQWTIEYKPSSDTSWANAISNTASATTYSLTNLTGNTSYNVRVKAVCVSGTSESDWRNGSFTTPYSCPAPTSLTVPSANITTTDALVSWNPTINPVNWNEGYLLQYKPSSVSDWNLATSVSAIQDTFYLIQGLNPSTGYSVRLKAVCNPGVDSSSWTNTASFSTLCVPINTFPWAESFEGLAGANALPNNCWTATSNTGTQNTNYNSYNRNARTGTGAAYFRWGCSDSFKTPSFQFAANTSYDFSFWYVTDGLSGWNTLRAELWDATTNTLVDTLGSQVNNPTNTNYSLYTSSFIVPNENDSYYVSIYCQSTSNPWYLTIDDISVEPTPTCPSAFNLTSALRSSTSVDLNWMQNGDGSGWVIAYGDTTGFDPSTATQTIIVSSTDPVPYTITGLNPQTPYSFAVRHNCTNGAWSNIISLTTPANAATLPYFHSFEDVTENTSWSFINGTQTNQWVIGTAADTLGTNGLYISNDQGVTNAYTGGSSNLSRVYAYRDFEVPAGAGELELSFDWRAQGGSAHTDFLRMYLVPIDANVIAGVIPPNGLDASAQIGNYTGGTGEHWLSQSTAWQHKTMRINSLQFPNLAGRTWRLLVHWRNESSTTTGIQPPAAVDNINLSVVTCSTPTTLVASNPTTTSTDLSWQETGQATNWIIEYKEIAGSTWNQASANTNPFTLTGLTNSSNYQVRVRSLCSANDTSLASQTITFNTACDLITSFPWSEGFESSWVASQLPGNASAPNCWTNINKGAGTSNLWTRNTYNYHTGTGSAQMYTDNNSQNNDWLITPQMALQGNERLRFWAMNYSSTTSEVDEISIWISNENLVIDTTNMGVYDSLAGFTQIYQTGIPIGDWQQYEVNLSQYQGNRYIAFVRRNTPNNGWDLRLDDVLIEPIPSCARPTNVISVNNNLNDIEIGWTNGNATDASWYVYYRPIGATNYDSVLANSNPYILTNLSSSTIYNVYVRTDCSTDLSEASPVVNLATECGSVSIPWSEGFESSWNTAVAPGNASAPNCWTNVNKGAGTSNLWTRSTYNYHTGTGSAQMYTDNSNQNNDWLITPVLSLTGNERLRFWAMNHSSSTTEVDEISIWISNEDLSIDVSAMGDYDSIPGFTQIYQTGIPVGGWQQYEVNLSQFSGNRNIAFVRRNTPNDGWNLRLDDILVDAQPACARPTAATTTNAVGTSVDITFTPGNTADASWYVYYKPTASTDWDSINVTSNPATLSNLTLQTTYEIYVKTDCGNGVASEASNTITYTTPCYLSAINTFPWTEGFENGISCWQINSSTNDADWTSETSGYSPTATPHGGLNMIMFNSNNLNSGEWSTIYSPVLNLPNDQYQVSFWMFRDNNDYLTTADRVELYVNSTASTTGATLLGTINRSYSLTPIETTGGWHQYSFTLPSGTTGNQYVILKGLSEYGRNIYVDDLTVDVSGVTPCPDPTSVLVSNVGTTTADVTWTAGGSETSWEVRLGTTGTPVSVTSPTYQLTGLTQGTNYTVYVRANCGTGYSSWVASTPFTTTSSSVLTVVTLPQTSVSQTSAILNGTVAPGTAPILSQGFEWKETSATTWTVQPAAGTTITYTLTTLTPNTSYTYRAFAMTSTDTVRGIDISFTTLSIVPPTVATSAATSVAQTTATLNGTITAGSETITAKGFDWRVVGTTTWNNQPVTAATLTYNLSALTANTTYEYKAYVTTTTTTYGSVVTFTTLPNSVTPPTVVTSPASNIAQTSADLNGTVTQGTNPVLTQGFEWRLANTTSWTRVPVTGTLTHTLTGLTANTSYEFRAYAITSIDTTNGLTLNFTTLPIPVVLGDVTTLEATNVDNHNAILNGILVNVGNALSNVKVGFVYSTMTNPEIGGTNVITDSVPYTVGMTSFSKPISGLQSNTSYFCRAYVTNSAGTKYGDEKTFITLGLVNPESEGFSVSMYPNPATSTTKLVVSGVAGEAKIVISDVQGRIINTINAKSANGVVEQTIDVNNLAKGVYYVRIQNSTTSRTQKLIVQ